MSITKRRFLEISGTVAVPATIAGCTGDEPDDTNEDTDEGTDAEENPGEPTFEILRSTLENEIGQVEGVITAAVSIENVGDGAGSASVGFNLDVSQKVEETTNLSPGETEQVVADIEVPLIDPGRYDLTVELDEQQETAGSVAIFENLDDPGMYGAVSSEIGAELSGSTIRLIGFSPDNEFNDNNVTLDESGLFSSAPLHNGEHEVAVTLYSDTSGEFDGLPAVVAVDEPREISDGVEILGQYEIPEGYRTEVQLVDESGNPISDFSNFNVRDGNGNGIRDFTTDQDGYLIAQGASERDISLPSQEASNVQIDARPQGEERNEVFGRVYGSEDGEEFVVEVPEPTRFQY